MMMEDQTQVTSCRDQEERLTSRIPSSNPLEGLTWEDIQEDYMNVNENCLTIADTIVSMSGTLKKKMADQLKEFKDKEKKWEEEMAKLKKEHETSGHQYRLWRGQHEKLLGCIRKLARVTEFPCLEKCPLKEGSGSDLDFVGDILLDRFSEHVESKIEELKRMKKNSPVCDDELVVPVVGCSRNIVPAPMTSGGSLEKPRGKNLKKNLFSSGPATYAEVLKKKIEPERKLATEPVKDKLTTVKKSDNCSSDAEKSQMVRCRPKRKITVPARLMPFASGEKRTSGGCSSSSRLDSSRQNKGHLTDVDLVQGEVKIDNNPSVPVAVAKKSRLAAASSTIPVQTKTVSKLGPSETTTISSSDRYEGMPIADGPFLPHIPYNRSSAAAAGALSCKMSEAKSSGAGAVHFSHSCSVCECRFSSMAALNFHVRKRHDGNGGQME